MADLVSSARSYATEAHHRIDHRRKYNDQPYHVHLSAVAKLVASVTDDEEMIAPAVVISAASVFAIKEKLLSSPGDWGLGGEEDEQSVRSVSCRRRVGIALAMLALVQPVAKDPAGHQAE